MYKELNEEKSKSQPEETIAERLKLMPRERKSDSTTKKSVIPPVWPLEGDQEKNADEEEVKEGKVLKIVTPNNLLTRPPILLAQIKAGNNSNKRKN